MKFLRSAFHIHRPGIAGLYISTYLVIVTIFAHVLGHPNPQELSLAVLAFFPIGIALLFFHLEGISAPIALGLGYLFYLSLLFVGVITRRRFIYVIFILIILANIGGCIKGFHGN